MEKIINVIDFGGNLERSKRNQLCLYYLKKENPDFKIKIWDEHNEEVLALMSDPFYKSLSFYSPQYEYLKLSLMLNHGGLWSECDQIFKVPELDTNYSYLQACWNLHGIVSFNFCTWGPVYINNSDVNIREKLNLSLQRLKNFENFKIIDYSGSDYPPEASYQNVIFVPTWLIKEYGTRKALDCLGETSVEDNVGMFSSGVHFAECFFQNEYASNTQVLEHPLFDTMLTAFLMSLPSTVDIRKYRKPNQDNVDFELLNTTTYESVRRFLS